MCGTNKLTLYFETLTMLVSFLAGIRAPVNKNRDIDPLLLLVSRKNKLFAISDTFYQKLRMPSKFIPASWRDIYCSPAVIGIIQDEWKV